MKTRQLRIQSAADLIETLRAAEPVKRLSLLKHIANHPDQALRFGSYQGRDVLDELIAQMEHILPGDLRYWNVVTIANFRDPRAVRFLLREVPDCTHPKTVVACILRLAEEKTPEVRDLLLGFLGRGASTQHARLAASVLSSWPGLELPLDQWLRLSLLSDTGWPLPPPLDEQTLDLWLGELEGDAARRAWTLLELQGEPAYVFLCQHRRRLSEAGFLALLDWGKRRFPPLAAGLVEEALDASSPPAVAKGLELLALLPEAQASHAEALGRLWREDPSLRCAVLQAGLSGLDWEGELAQAREVRLRQELLAGAVRQRGAEALPLVLGFLEDRQWQMRALAVRLAGELGAAALEPARELTRSPRAEVKLAACQLLMRLGQQEWLEQNVV